MPVCFEFVEAGSQPVMGPAGFITANHTTGPEGVDFRFQWEQTLETAGGESWVLAANWSSRMAPGEDSFILDGSYAPDGGELYVDFRLCKGDCSTWEDIRWFDSCRVVRAVDRCCLRSEARKSRSLGGSSPRTGDHGGL